jgi:hypothetical protein
LSFCPNGKGQCSAIEIASFVDPIRVVCELEWVQVAWDHGVDVSHDHPFKPFHGYRCECYESFSRGYLSVLGHRDYGGLLETSWYYRPGQG